MISDSVFSPPGLAPALGTADFSAANTVKSKRAEESRAVASELCFMVSVPVYNPATSKPLELIF